MVRVRAEGLFVASSALSKTAAILLCVERSAASGTPSVVPARSCAMAGRADGPRSPLPILALALMALASCTAAQNSSSSPQCDFTGCGPLDLAELIVLPRPEKPGH